MSDTKIYNYPDRVIHWDALPGTKYGDLPELTVNVPATISGRVDIWLCPKCEAYPDGYFVTISNYDSYGGNEPGCDSNDKHLLCKVRFSGVDSGVSNGSAVSGGTNAAVAEYWNKVLPDQASSISVPDPVEVNE